IINACDAGREGELIFRYIIQYAGTKKPIKRLWLQSMTPEAIRDGFDRLRTDAEMQPLASAARSRNEADWLVGINATRAFTLRLSGGRGSTVTSLGRVQTPTLTIIVDRERKILEFKPREVHEIIGKFRAGAGEYAGRWFDEPFKKDETESGRTQRLLGRLQLNLPDAEQRLDSANGSLWDEHRAAPRLWHREIADAIQGKCSGKQGIVELEEKKPTTQVAPQLYDLTTLQREANNRFGLSAKRTLQIAQALYEKHKAITYPPAQDENTTRITRVEGEAFKTEGKILVASGWLEVYGREAASDKPEENLPPVRQGERVATISVEIRTDQTKPPARYTEATILGAMEAAGKLVEDEELRDAMKEKGLGTPATRASIIETLISAHYLTRQGKELQPTAKAIQTITLLKNAVPELTSPELTGEWEFRLREIEHRKLTRDAFMRDIR